MTEFLQVPTASGAATTLSAGGSNDATLIRLWLAGRSRHTERSYGADIGNLLAHAGKPIAALTLVDLQDWAGSPAMIALAPATRARRIKAVKSLLSFAERTGLLRFNIGAALRVPPVKSVLAERILEEAEVIRLIALETDPRNHAILRLGYLAGLRISELVGLRWRDARPRGTAGQMTIFGKGGKTRVVMLPAGMWRELEALRGDAGDNDPIFPSGRGGGPLDPSMVHRIVKRAAARAGLSPAVSAHYLRHAHVSHALDRGAPAHLVQATVGHSDLRTTSLYAHARPNESSSTYLVDKAC